MTCRDLLRQRANDGSVEGQQIRKIMNEGRLVTDELAQTVVNKEIMDALGHPDIQGVLLDGYPRTIHQVHLLDDTLAQLHVSRFKVVDIKLERSVAVAKLLNRKQCETCGESFNTADIVTGTYDMPAILPNPETCPLKERCNPVLTMRGDDTEETIITRLQQHEENIAPILNHYAQKGTLDTFNVYKGVKDVDALIEVMLK